MTKDTDSPLHEDQYPDEIDHGAILEESSDLETRHNDQPTEPSEASLAYDKILDTLDPTIAKSAEKERKSTNAYWPTLDLNAPDYRHVDGQQSNDIFEIVAEDIETLIAANRFNPRAAEPHDVICLAFRGLELQNSHEVVQQSAIAVRDVRPNHVNFRCLLGFYYRNQGKITLFSGSTVPCPVFMEQYYFQENNLPHWYNGGCNMLPTGCYIFRVNRHRKLRPALRLTNPESLLEDAKVTVLQTTNDLAYGTQDIWDNCQPFDNVHCSYYLNWSSDRQAYFSSAGCLTVRGRKDPSHQWKKFQNQLDAIGWNKRCDLILLTGKECAIAAQLRNDGALGDEARVEAALGRLRTGSQGEEIRKMQQQLGFQGSGYFGRATKERLSIFQRNQGIPSDGIFSPDLEEQLDWDVFGQIGT